MKIVIQEASGNTITVPVPNFLVTSPAFYRFGLSMGKRYAGDAMPQIPTETLIAVANALKQAKKQNGSWELVHVESASGEIVTITF